MNRRILIGVAVVLVALIAAAAIGTTAYRAGIVRGLADAGRLPDVGGFPYYYYGPFWHHGPFGLLFPVLGVLLLFGLLRALFWGWRCGGYDRWSKTGVPPRFEEWHRRAHESTGGHSQNA